MKCCRCYNVNSFSTGILLELIYYWAQREKGRPRRKRRTLKKKKSRKKKQRETTEETWGRIMTKREGNGVGMKKEDQSGWFGSKCYILKTVRAEIEKQNQQKKEKLLQAEGVAKSDQ